MGRYRYEVWCTQGQGGVLMMKFKSFRRALVYALRGISNKEGSFAIKLPNGAWYDWEKGSG